MPTRCALYVRQSRDHFGDGLAVARQREACQAVAERNGWTVVGEYCDNDISASDRTKVRPGYEAMLEAFRQGELDAIAVYDLDRLTRQPRQLEDIVDLAEHNGLLIATVGDSVNLGSDNGRLFTRIKAAVARSEVERKSARQRFANEQRLALGKQLKGTRPFGYTQDGQVDQAEAEQVRRFFDGFAAGESLKSLAEGATVPTRTGRPWGPDSVRYLLKNPKYKGALVHRGEVLAEDSDLAPIVDAALFDVVNVKLSDPRRRTAKSTHRKHLGSGLYRDEAGHVMTKNAGYYACKEQCYHRKVQPADDLIRELVAARLDMPDARQDRSRIDPEAAAEVQRLRNRLAAVEGDYDAGLIDGRRLKAATERISVELAEAEARLAKSLNPAVEVTSGQEFLGLSLMRQRAVVDALLTVTLLRAPVGRRFDPATVRVEWK